MTRPHSNDLREREVAAVRSGSKVRIVAERFGVTVSRVVKWSQREEQTGVVTPDKIGGYRKPIPAALHDWLMGRVRETLEVTMVGLRDELRAQGGRVSNDSVWRYLRGVGPPSKNAFWLTGRTSPMSRGDGLAGSVIKLG